MAAIEDARTRSLALLFAVPLLLLLILFEVMPLLAVLLDGFAATPAR